MQWQKGEGMAGLIDWLISKQRMARSLCNERVALFVTLQYDYLIFQLVNFLLLPLNIFIGFN
jgi:large-conductance mechanosensitive channel